MAPPSSATMPTATPPLADVSYFQALSLLTVIIAEFPLILIGRVGDTTEESAIPQKRSQGSSIPW
jgi:hypothetical protein